MLGTIQRRLAYHAVHIISTLAPLHARTREEEEEEEEQEEVRMIYEQARQATDTGKTGN